MKPFKTAAVGATAPTLVGERASAHDPGHVPTVAPLALNTPVVLSLRDTERLRGRCLELMSLCDELGIYTCSINLHRVARLSAWEVFPDGVERISEITIGGRKYGTRQHTQGQHDVTLFTGDIDPDAIEGVAS